MTSLSTSRLNKHSELDNNQINLGGLSLAFATLIYLLTCLLSSILRPVEYLTSVLPHFISRAMFSSKSFNPEKDIPDLSGKVILVTGGKSHDNL